MVSVLHEIHLADLVQLDRRHLGPFAVGAVDALPAVSRPRLPREEGAVEIAVAADASYDAIDRDFLKAPVALRLRMNSAPRWLISMTDMPRSALSDRLSQLAIARTKDFRRARS